MREKRFPGAFWYLWAGTLVNRLGSFGYTFLPFYLAQNRQMPVHHIGFILGLYGAGSFCSGPIGGMLADRFGRRFTMLLSFVLSGSLLFQLAFAVASWHIALSALALGFCTDLYRPAVQAVIADLVPSSERTRAYGYLYWAINLGLAGAALLGGGLASQSFKLLFIANALTTLMFGLIVLSRVPESRPQRSTDERPPLGLLLPFRDRTFMGFVVTQLLVTLVFAQVSSTLPIDMKAHGLSPSTYGILLSINGIMICVLQPLAIRWVQRPRRGVVLAVGAVLTGAGMGVNGFVSTPVPYAFGIALWTLGELAFSPVAPTVVADLAPAALRASYQGTFQMSWGAAWFLAPMLGSLVLGRFGSFTLWCSCMAVGGVAAVLHLVIAPGVEGAASQRTMGR